MKEFFSDFLKFGVLNFGLLNLKFRRNFRLLNLENFSLKFNQIFSLNLKFKISNELNLNLKFKISNEILDLNLSRNLDFSSSKYKISQPNLGVQNA